MIIKKYQGKTEYDAMESAKRELGEGLVLMNSKSVKQKGIKRLFKGPVIEVTVAKEDDSERLSVEKRSVPLKQTQSFGTDETKLEEKLDNLQVFLKEQLAKQQEMTESSSNMVSPAFDETVAEEISQEEVKLKMFLDLLENTLVDNEVDLKYADMILKEVRATVKPELPMDYVIASVYQKMILKFGKAETIFPAKDGPKVVFFVGTTGVGKTTTIAKIASRLCVNDKKKVVLLTADTYRIAAAEQLKTYANILEIPFRVIYDSDGMKSAVSDFDRYDYILVDTAGHSQYNDEQKDNMSDLIESVHYRGNQDDSGEKQEIEKEVYLVLSATTKYKDLLKIANSYKKISNYKLIFTKLDETESYGNLLNLKLYTEVPLSYVTCGQNVPDDIEEFSPQKTVKKLLESKE